VKRSVFALLVLATSFSAHASWDGSGFYGTKSTKEIERKMNETFRIPTGSATERVTVYTKVPASVYRSINYCTTSNYSLQMSRASTASLNPNSAAVVYEKRSNIWDTFAPAAYIIVPQDGPLYAVDPTVTPCKVWELVAGNAQRETLTAAEAATVKPTASVLLGLFLSVKIAVEPQGTSVDELGVEYLLNLAQGNLEWLKSQHAIDFLSKKPSLDATVIKMANAGLCGEMKLNENTAKTQLVVGFRTGPCYNFKDFAMKGDASGEMCLQAVSAPTYEAARDFYTQDRAKRNPALIPGLRSSSVVTATKLYEAMSAAGCLL